MPVRLCIGDAVLVYMSPNEDETTTTSPQNITEEHIHIGVIKYIGFIHGFDMAEYVGIELVESIENGHSGTINGYQYFTSHSGHGIHTRITNVIRKLEASEVTIKMQEIIMLFKQRMGEYVRAVSERDEYIEELKNTQRNLRRLLKEHNKHVQETAPSRKFATVISNIESPSFSFVSQKQNTFAMFKSTKMQSTESEGDISIASMQTDLSNMLKLNTIDEIKSTKIDPAQPDLLGRGLDALDTCSIATPVTPITPVDSGSLQSDSEILHVTSVMESPDFSSTKSIRTKTLKTRFGDMAKKQLFPDMDAYDLDNNKVSQRAKKRRVNNVTHKKTKLHSRSSSEHNINYNNKNEYTKYGHTHNRRVKKQKRSKKRYTKRRLDTETEEETQSVSSYESFWDDPTETETEWSEYYEEEYDNNQPPQPPYNNNVNLYTQAKKYKNIKYKNNKNVKNDNNTPQYTKNRYLPFKSASNPPHPSQQSQYTQMNNMNNNMNTMYVVPDTTYYNQRMQAAAARHPSIGSPNNSGHSPSSLGSELPQSFTNPAVASMSAGNLRKLVTVYDQNNMNMYAQGAYNNPSQSKNVRKRQVKFVKPVLELRNNTCNNNNKQKNNEFVTCTKPKDNIHRRSYTWDPVACGGLLPPDIVQVQNNNMMQAYGRGQVHHGHGVQYSQPMANVQAYYRQPVMDEWMQQMQVQPQTTYFHHN